MKQSILRVDLTEKKYWLEPVPQELSMLFIAGRGLGAYYAFKEIPKGIDPLSPENSLMFFPGLLAATPAPGFSKWTVVTKSPLTGTYARSICGGRLGPAMAFLGLNGLVIKGSFQVPGYLFIHREGVEFLEAREIWGESTFKTQELLKERHGSKVSIATIGIAGEKQVLFSSIIHEKRAAARLGVGAVMGSKNLKAIVIDPKEGRPPKLYNKEGFSKLTKEHALSIKEHPRRIRLQELGTTFMTKQMHELGIFPVKNFQEGFLSGIEDISAEAFSKLKIKDYGCYGCTTRCGNVFKVREGPHSGVESEGPEYETIFAFGGEINNTDPGLIIYSDYLCDYFGIDTISMGVVVGFVMELFQRDIITADELDGLEAHWGKAQVVEALIYKVVKREGIGDLLAKGTRRASIQIGRGAEHYAMHVKGLELPGYEPRAAKAHGLGYAVSNIGGSHMYGYARQEISGLREPREIDRLADEGKGDIVAWNQIKKAVEETGILCNFADTNITQKLISDLYYEATGIPEFSDLDHLWDAGRRIVILERLFNLREGFTRKDDRLPERFSKEPLPNAGPSTGSYYKNYEVLLDEYYEAMGLDEEGRPKQEIIVNLKLGDLI